VEPLAVQFRQLFAICDRPNILVASVFRFDEGHPWFRHTYGPIEREQWLQLELDIQSVVLNNEPEKLLWTLEPSVLFSVGSVYHALHQRFTVFRFEDIWKKSNTSSGRWLEAGFQEGMRFKSTMGEEMVVPSLSFARRSESHLL
jgi:hypothetical protein